MLHTINLQKVRRGIRGKEETNEKQIEKEKTETQPLQHTTRKQVKVI